MRGLVLLVGLAVALVCVAPASAQCVNCQVSVTVSPTRAPALPAVAAVLVAPVRVVRSVVEFGPVRRTVRGGACLACKTAKASVAAVAAIRPARVVVRVR